MNEAQLELSVMELFQAEGYEYISGDSVLRETTDVLLKDDLQAYLLAQSEVESIIFSLVRASHDPLYDANREMLTKIREGFVFRRDDKTKKDLFIRLIDFDIPDANIFKVVNQVEIQGMEQLRIPDAIVYVNGLPLMDQTNLKRLRVPGNFNIIQRRYKFFVFISTKELRKRINKISRVNSIFHYHLPIFRKRKIEDLKQ